MTHPQVLSDEQILSIGAKNSEPLQFGREFSEEQWFNAARAIESATLEAVAAQEPFGYFRALPFGWEQCAETDEGAVALYERPSPTQPPAQADAIKAELIDELTICRHDLARLAAELRQSVTVPGAETILDEDDEALCQFEESRVARLDALIARATTGGQQ
jgi:hypothetical protein